MMSKLACVGLFLGVIQCRTATDSESPAGPDAARKFLENQLKESKTPGIQYAATTAEGPLFEFAGGAACIDSGRPLDHATSMMLYSMTKTFTAVAVLQLVEQGKIGIDDSIQKYLPEIPYKEKITIRQLLAQTSGIPDPIPLRWVHLASEQDRFNEEEALKSVLDQNPKLEFSPGEKYAYSNISYWLLGRLVARVSNERFEEYVGRRILLPLGLPGQKAGFTIADPSKHACGYLPRWSLLDIAKPFFIDRKFIAGYEKGWLRFTNHYLNGPSFGGLVSSAGAVSLFLRDMLAEQSRILGPTGRQLLFAPQRDNNGSLIEMSLGWHIRRKQDRIAYFYKEGGGGGFHSEMRIYPASRVGTVIIANNTTFDVKNALDQVDGLIIRD